VDRSDKVFVLLVIVALAAAVWLAVGRVRVEQSNRTVEIILDADDVRQVAAAAGLSTTALLGQLREAGASALAVREVTLGQLAQSGRIEMGPAQGGTEVVTLDPELGGRLEEALRARLPQAEASIADTRTSIRVPLEGDQLSEVPLFLRSEDLRAAESAGMRVVARPLNSPITTARAIEHAAAGAEAARARLIVFDQDQVLGYPGLLGETTLAFRRHDLRYGFVEMAGQLGDSGLARRLSSSLIRVHSISDSDMETMLASTAVARYTRAVRERNIRACYVRLLVGGREDPAGANVRYVRNLSSALRAGGFQIGPPAPFEGPIGWPPKWLRGLVLLGLPPALLLLLRRFVPLRPGMAWILLLVVSAAAVGLVALNSQLAVSLGGLAAAVIFPTLGVVTALQAARGPGARLTVAGLAGRAGYGLAAASVVTAIGGLFIAGLLSPVAYLSGVGQFAGVKLAYLAPLALIVAAVVADLGGRAEPREVWWTRLRLRAGQALGRPVTVIEAVVILAVVGAIAFAVMRSGNQAVMAPSGAELKFRSLLESLLVVRPRTKEFLVGHPALMLAIVLALRNRRTWLPFVALLAGVGQVSLLNTFCHLHTPLLVTLLRSVHGLWIGALVGGAVVIAWGVLFDRRPRPIEP